MILGYHEIVSGDSTYLYSLSHERLEAHVHFLTLPVPSACAGTSLLTFDDGCASHYEHAIPILQKYGRGAIFFVTAGWTDVRPKYMTSQQLREIVSMGHEVQSHGWSHKYLTHCSGPELATELERSKKSLEDRLGMAVEAISAPGGAWNSRVSEACARAGYKRFYISDPWFRTRERCGLKISGRMMVRRTLDPAALRHLLEAERKRFSMLRTTFRLKQTVRTLVGDRAYHRLWLWFAEAGEEIKAESYF